MLLLLVVVVVDGVVIAFINVVVIVDPKNLPLDWVTIGSAKILLTLSFCG